MQRTLITLLLAQTLLVATSIYSNNENDEPCVYHAKDGVINLTSIVAIHKDSFQANFAGNGTTKKIYYNPCYDFYVTDVPPCDNKAVCVVTKNGTGTIDGSSFGTSESLKYEENVSSISLNYTTKDGKNKTFVTLLCQQDLKTPNLTVTNFKEQNELYMTLATECACPNKCIYSPPTPMPTLIPTSTSKPKPSDHGLSAGSILLIIFFVGAFVYLFGGILFSSVMKGASGFESIPHYEFWLDLPLLIRDGVVFTMNGCKVQVGYDRI